MKKFKLIKWYPSIPKFYEVGNIVRLCECYYCDLMGNRIASKNEVEDNPEFWDEIIEKPILFITEDGVDVFSGDRVYYVLKNLALRVYNPTTDDRSVELNHYFKSEAKAVEYIKLNAPRYSINDLMNMMGKITVGYGESVYFIGILISDLEKLKEDVLSNK